MSNTYDTSAEPLGSTAVKVVYNNASNLDDAVNSLASETWVDRPPFNRIRKTLFGYEQQFYRFMSASAYENPPLEYVDGETLQVDRATQVVSRGGNIYSVQLPSAFPVVLTGNWATDQDVLVVRGDQSLRSDLSQPDGAETLVGGALYKGEVLSPTPSGTSLTRGTVHAYYDQGVPAGSVRIGGSDLTSLNDERNLWRGLPSQDAWGDLENIGFASAAFNRNGASYAAYSTTFGHDCVTYGTASIAGGAGSGTGNADTPDAAFTGYCSLAFGKNVYVPGQKSAGLGEEHLLNVRAGMGFGYSVSLQPSVATPEPVGSAGIGQSINVTGQGQGLGSYLNVSDGILIGTGLNASLPLNSGNSGELGLGMRAELPAIRITSPLAEERSRIGINNKRSLNNEIDIDITPGQRMGITVDGIGTATLALMGVKNDGSELPLVSFVWSHTNGGTALGDLEVRMNGRSVAAFAIAADGSIRMGELKTAANVSGSPAGTLYNDAGTLKVV